MTVSSRSRPVSTITLSAATLVATAAGAALGLKIVSSEWFPAVPIMVVGLGLIAGGAVAVVMNGGVRARPGAWPSADTRPPSPAGDEVPPSPELAESGVHRHRAEPEHVQQLLPVPSGQWWGRDAPMATRPTSTPPPRQIRGPELAEYLDSSIVAQCPNCGGFLLEAVDTPPGYRFCCRACGSRWEWQPGAPWPPVRVSPRLRGDRASSS